jgi:hypothetical protein
LAKNVTEEFKEERMNLLKKGEKLYIDLDRRSYNFNDALKLKPMFLKLLDEDLFLYNTPEGKGFEQKCFHYYETRKRSVGGFIRKFQKRIIQP